MRSVTKTLLLGALAVTATGCQMLREHQTAAGYVGDSAITARLRQALIKDPSIEASQIGVQTYEGQVTLLGVVDDEAMARRVLHVAEQTPGVRSVRNSLQIVAAPTAPTELTARER
jgi:hyperosmotically inducible periplasmic protein